MIRLGIYRHYKGNLYQLLGISRHSETLEKFVVYQALYGDYGIWIRPFDMFFEKIEKEGKEIYRFEFISETWAKAPSVKDGS